MNPKQKLQNELKEALKTKSELKTSVLKMLIASIVNEEIKLSKKEQGLNEEETQKVIRSEAKKRQDAMEAYRQGGRPESAEQEKAELAILEAYLPKQLKDEKLKKIIQESIAIVGAASMADFGKVMKEVIAKVNGQADGQRISMMVKDMLHDS